MPNGMWSAQLPNSSAKPAAIGQTTCDWRSASYINAEAFVVQTGRYRSGQTGQTVNLLALRLRWFESSPAQIFSETVACVATRSASSRRLFVGHHHADRRHIRRRRNVHHRRRRHHLVAAARADALRLQSLAGHPWSGR